MIKTSWFKTYTQEELPKEFELVFQSWDTANKSSELSDYSCCTTWGVRENKLYLLHVFRKRLDYPDLRRAVKHQALLYEAKNIVIEDKASGTQLLQDLREDGVHGATGYETQMDKIMRMHSVSSTIENGFVFIPTQAEWVPEYLHEISAFPKGKYDDQVDSTSQALDWLKQGRCCFGLLDWFREQQAKQEGRALHQGARSLPRCEETSHCHDARKNNPDGKRTTQIDSRPCEGCNGTMSQRIPGGLRCMQ